MTRRRLAYVVVAATAIAAGGGLLAIRSSSTDGTTVSTLAEKTHFHGIAVDRGGSSRLYLATHHGLYVVAPDGKSSRISETRDDFMGFTVHPTDSAIMYASGHPAGGGNLGFIISNDGGRSWTKLADGVGGPVDFHQMDVSRADPKVVYGVYEDLQRSRDGGRTWERLGPAPEGLIDLAASSKDAVTLYAATENGLIKTEDAGRSWQPAHVIRRPATMVHVAGGEVYAFIVGTGLVRAADGAVSWQLVNNAFGEDYVLHLAVDATGDGKLYAVTLNPQTRAQAVLVSGDRGETWASFGAK